MNKTITINIGGVVFNIDENGYSILDQYLISLRKHFGTDAAAEEIVSDIELRIAEIFSDKTELSKGIVSIADVKEVVKSMGQPEEFENDGDDTFIENVAIENNISKYENPNVEKTEKAPKKFMRDSDDRVIGGVAAGIAHYFSINVVLVRLIYFILLAFVGVGLIPYLLMWLIIPKATSTIDKLKMRGEAVNIETIAHSNRIEAIEKSKPQTSSQHFFNVLASLLSKFGSFSLAFLRMAMLLIAIIGFAVLVSLLVAFGYGFIMTPNNILSFFIESNLSAWVSAIASIIFLAIPILFLVFSIILLLFNRKIWNQQLALILIGFWLFSAVLFGLNTYDISKDFKELSTTSKELPLNFNTNKGVYLDANDKKLKSKKELLGTNISLMSYTFTLDEDSIYLTQPKLKIEKSLDYKYHLFIDLEARGRTVEKATERMQQIFADVQLKKNKLILSNYASFYKDNLYRLQKFSYRLQVPENGKIRISENVLNLFTDITDEMPQTKYDSVSE